WDSSPGLFGRWNPLTYRTLTITGSEEGAIADMTTPEWIQLFGALHVGGGPAAVGTDGELLNASADPLVSSMVDPVSGELTAWDWQQSGIVEMNCFLCHTATPDNDARVAALQSGDFAWASTATLTATGIVASSTDGWSYEGAAFDEDGNVRLDYLGVQDPTDENCGACHGIVHSDARTPLVADFCGDGDPTEGAAWSTLTTGQIFSPQRLATTGLNLSAKESLSRSWDIHAERVVGCTDCHYSLNNPIYYRESDASQPSHLLFDPRRIDISDYLERPLHQFAKGQSPQSGLAPEFDNSLRRCESCHNIETTHDWLPYKERHTAALSCETCHVPQLYAPAQQAVDWTVLDASGNPVSACRGIEATSSGPNLLTGYQPVLLPRENGDGTTSLAPHNLISAWYWVYGEPAQPVPLRLLQDAWLEGDGYAPELLDLFDADGNGALAESELRIDDEAKEAAVAARLGQLGLENPRIAAEVQAYSVSHNVATGDWATQDCQSCHSNDSLVTTPMQLASYIPGGVMPGILAGNGTAIRGELTVDDEGALYYQPQTKGDRESGAGSIYVLGHDNLSWVDWFGALAFLGTLGGVALHGGIRFFAMRYGAHRYAHHDPELRRVYMYGVYERFWHWLQTLVILGLLFTGLIIHKPDMFAIFSFRHVVLVHNVLAAILVINAALSAFYHLASGEIQQFIPRPRGFFDQAFEQAKFYLGGIFRGEEHPTVKTRERKLNPLQQLTYFGLLNVLLPLQVITGLLMWGAQRWPEIAAALGGLPGLAPFHTLISWTLASFVVMHVYLTTTGHTATANIKAMIMGWDEVEGPTQPQEVS
ncbi:MAG: cytochrome b/b6 domain-containing protein, partial [Anaerolineae bacterium]|nr:cytochrome b/b6 domain-containing protein [Anaerolineae bacterium]